MGKKKYGKCHKCGKSLKDGYIQTTYYKKDENEKLKIQKISRKFCSVSCMRKEQK